MVGRAHGFTLIELLMVMACLGLVASMSAPSLLRARLKANEASAVASLRTIVTAESTYASTCGNGSFATDLSDLAQPPASGGPFIGPDLGFNGVVKSGYAFELSAGDAFDDAPADTCNDAVHPLAPSFLVTADPLAQGSSGDAFFATDAAAIIHEGSGEIVAEH